MTVLTPLAFGVHPLGCSSEVHGERKVRCAVQRRNNRVQGPYARFSENVRKPGRADLPVRQVANQCARSVTMDSGPVDLSTIPQIAVPKSGEIRVASQKLRKSLYSNEVCIFQGNRTVPTFRLDGGTVPHQKERWRFQKPYILCG
jgi:hypothetical protein